MPEDRSDHEEDEQAGVEEFISDKCVSGICPK
jgi:hypothetical protein